LTTAAIYWPVWEPQEQGGSIELIGMQSDPQNWPQDCSIKYYSLLIIWTTSRPIPKKWSALKPQEWGTHCNPAVQSPYGSELSGVYGILCVVEELCHLYQIWLVVSLLVVIMTINKPGSFSPKSKCFFGILSVIRSKIGALPISPLSSHWTKGHQDSNYTKHPSCLDLSGQTWILKWIHLPRFWG
jgi:hypothetical protein